MNIFWGPANEEHAVIFVIFVLEMDLKVSEY